MRAALAAPRHTLRAGFLVGAAMAVALLLTLVAASFLIVMVTGPGVPVRSAAGWQVVPGTATPGTPGGSPLDILLPTVTTLAILGVAGAGTALVTRNRWRRAGARDTFIDLAPRRLYLLETAAVWLGVSGLIVAMVRVQAGPQVDRGGLALLVSFGIPTLASVFGFVFPSVYNRLLPRVSPLDAAAYARPIIECEAALRVKADRERSGRSVAHHSIYARDRWADEVLARSDPDTARRRR